MKPSRNASVSLFGEVPAPQPTPATAKPAKAAPEPAAVAISGVVIKRTPLVAKIARVLTVRDLIRGIVDKWAAYYGGPEWESDPSKGYVLAALRGLDLETATVADVAGVIGNKSWVTLICAPCGQSVEAVIEMGSARICSRCFGAAAQQIKAMKEGR